MTILGISVGTERTAVCVLKDSVLLDRQIHSYHESWSNQKLRTIIKNYESYIHERAVTAIMVKIPPLEKHSKAIRILLKRLEKLARDYQCDFDLITKRELKSVLYVRTTAELVQYATHLYPELSALYHKGFPTKHRYYGRLYEAVLAAYVFQERQKRWAQH